MKLTRREFLLTSSGLLFAAKSRVSAQNKKRIIVAGAGLSGLSDAYELAQRGFDVTIIEARNRIGGRIFTLREPFSDGLYTETGGELIGDGYKRFLGYADKFGIEYEKLQETAETGGSVADIQDGIGRSGYLKGKLYRQGTQINDNPYNLKDIEGKVLPPTLYNMNLRLLINELRSNKMTLTDFDKMSLAAALREKGVSEKAIELINISLNYNSIETVSTGGVLFDVIRRRNAGEIPLKIVGGNDRITDALAKAAQDAGVKFLLGSNIKKISHNKKGVRVSFINKNSKTETLEAEKLVCTIPFSVLRSVKFSPALPSAKTKAINELDYTQITKVFHQAKYFEWDRRALGSSIWTDTPLERIFSTTGKSGDERGLFTIWTDGVGSKFLEAMSDEKRIEYAREKFVEVLPFMKGSIEKSYTLSWSLDEFARGAYSHFKVGQLTSLKPYIKTPVGNIHFAGEHTAEESPGMEGALESAERVFKEITKS